MAGDRPPPYGGTENLLPCSARACPSRTSEGPGHGEGQALALREGKAFFFIVARGPVPRDRSMAKDRPSPYVKGRRFFTAARGPVTATLRDL